MRPATKAGLYRTSTMYDVIVVGGGAAALSAGIYAGRRGMKTLIIAKDLGGQAASTAHIENYPGVGLIDGRELMERFFDQAKTAGCEIIFDEVTAVRREGVDFVVSGLDGENSAHSVILAFGKTPRDLHVNGEKEFHGKGVSAALSPDLEVYRDKVVMVVGGGSSAVGSALALAGIAKKIYLVHRRTEFTAEAVLLQRLQEQKELFTIIFDAAISELKGEDHLTTAVVNHLTEERLEDVAVDEVIVHIGLEIRAEFIKELVELDVKKQVIVSGHMMTSCEGVFAAGDLTTSSYKQVVISAGEGASAALSAAQYVASKTGKKVSSIDWGGV